MNIGIVLKYTRIPSIALALFLQCTPVCRLVSAAPGLAAPFAYVLKFVGFAAAALGTVHAVTGASAVLITSPTNALATNGTAFRYRITENSPSTDPGVWYNAIPLPPGLVINTNTALITGTPTQTGIFVARLTAGYQNLLAIPTNLTINVYGKPVINSQPAAQTINAGTNASFTVSVAALPAPTFFWRLNGLLVRATTNSTLIVSNATVNDAGPYTVVASNFLGSVTSVVATLTVNSSTPVTITTQPQGRTALVGSNVTLSVSATGSSPITFQWRKGTNDIPSATNSSLMLGPLTLADAGDYTAVVKNDSGPVISSVARVNVVNLPSVGGYDSSSSGLRLWFTRDPGAAYEVVYADSLPPVLWTRLTNFPPTDVATPTALTNLNMSAENRFYQIRMSIP